MFKPLQLDAARRRVTLTVEGRTIEARDGDSLALALMDAGIDHTRTTPVSGAPRAPLCLMGVCFECLVEVDGHPNVQACMLEVRDGMRVRLQNGARVAGDFDEA
ncbi:(2Fe-2S)-binding protein [Chitinasiproducens palmae]|uniref:2Fe-2S iron-sulfur cluster binding domain-containing protein n=1 Tax=Chitinasiproducens palmae TaxID=1770053 RepID=A0A1H2PN35_9BURK|nr:(2Fe-2S)-binding protein [Chitinasiproducens palmae]SDV48032.1 2Fe-2S iron-sulfur cluster binding domain-containing protein [Chitinasiproducens palmae]